MFPDAHRDRFGRACMQKGAVLPWRNSPMGTEWTALITKRTSSKTC
jgi:hypothetical protein